MWYSCLKSSLTTWKKLKIRKKVWTKIHGWGWVRSNGTKQMYRLNQKGCSIKWVTASKRQKCKKNKVFKFVKMKVGNLWPMDCIWPMKKLDPVCSSSGNWQHVSSSASAAGDVLHMLCSAFPPWYIRGAIPGVLVSALFYRNICWLPGGAVLWPLAGAGS